MSIYSYSIFFDFSYFFEPQSSQWIFNLIHLQLLLNENLTVRKYTLQIQISTSQYIENLHLSLLWQPMSSVALTWICIRRRLMDQTWMRHDSLFDSVIIEASTYHDLIKCIYFWGAHLVLLNSQV